MSDMSGFDAYKTYLAVSNHFNRASYDFFKYNGNMRVKESSYLARKDKYFFEKASKRFNRDDFLKYLVANLTDHNTDNSWIGQMLNAKHEIIYKKWKKRIESASYNFKEELDTLWEKESNFDSLLKPKDGKHPLLYRLYLRGEVSLDTLVILDNLVHFTKLWRKQGDMMLDEVCTTISKYSPFFWHFTQSDPSKMRQIVLEIYS
jgi:hypothetical protein